MKRVRDMSIRKDMKVKEVIDQMRKSGGFMAKNFGEAYTILEKMFEEKECFKFLSFPACIISTGVRGIIKDLVKEKKFDCIITTCGTLDHDIARSINPYYVGSFDADDTELRKKSLLRLGNEFIPMDNYGKAIEEFMQPILNDICTIEFSTKELVWEFGKRMKRDSIMYWCYKNEIPVFIPGPFDGAFGSQLWMFNQLHRDFKIDLMKDEDDLAEICFNAKKSGALILGGGISKHHTIWWNQFKDGLDYAVYVTTAVEWDGSLSGARSKEAISWGKINERAKHVTLYGEITTTLPFLISPFL
jgi:deoxyhypusine synthase (EC 2.5.1.46)